MADDDDDDDYEERSELDLRFEKLEPGEYLQFDRVENKLSRRSDLHAFLLLDSIVPPMLCRDGKTVEDMVCGAEHDEIYLGVDIHALGKVITDDQIRDLIRCGVRYDEENDGLCMFA